MESIQKPGNPLLSPNAGTAQRSTVQKGAMTEDIISLEQNQIIRGLVTDIRPGEISIRLANKQAVNARLEGNNEVSIGDVASFKITENKNGEITLFKLNSTISPEEMTILKALEEANLPANTVNMEIVKQLLHNQLPINKESINRILKLTQQFKDASVSTLVYIEKNGLPLEESFIQTFEQVRGFQYHLLDNIQSAKDEFLHFMSQMANHESGDKLLPFTKQLFDLLEVQEMTPLQAAEVSNEVIDDVQDFSSIHANANPDSLMSLTKKDQTQLLQLFSSYDMPEEFITSIESNTVNLRDMVHHITEALTLAAHTSPEQIEAFKTPTVLNIMEQYGSFQRSNDELASFMSTPQRMELLDAIQDLPLSISTAAAIANGEINSAQFLSLISGYVNSEYAKTIKKLLGEDSFHKLISHQFSGEFTLNPEQLKEADGLDKYYLNVQEKMEKLKTLTKLDNISSNPANFLEKVDGVKTSFDFMKTFNQLFTYVQLPVKLTNQITHGDLYVYTNKEKLKVGTDQISVLLHLDMDHLGPLDIHLALSHSNIQSKFYVQDKEVRTLLAKHEEMLRTSLSKIGYQLQFEIHQQTKEVDILKDLTTEPTKTPPIKRYSFDIRA